MVHAPMAIGKGSDAGEKTELCADLHLVLVHDPIGRAGDYTVYGYNLHVCAHSVLNATTDFMSRFFNIPQVH